MNATQALTALRKLLGPKAGIQDSGKASSPEQRAAERELYLARKAIKDAAAAAMTSRREAILAADSEYQRRRAEHDAARALLEKTGHGYRYRYMAGTLGALFFTVEAEGDTLQEVVDKVRAKKAPKAAA